jgi:hypothetical protein
MMTTPKPASSSSSATPTSKQTAARVMARRSSTFGLAHDPWKAGTDGYSPSCRPTPHQPHRAR